MLAELRPPVLEVGPPAETGVEPAEGFIVTPLLLHFDQDRDEQLSRAEYRRIDTASRHGIDMDAADVNQDGYVDRIVTRPWQLHTRQPRDDQVEQIARAGSV